MKNQAIDEMLNMNKRALKNEATKQNDTTKTQYSNSKNTFNNFQKILSDDDILIIMLMLILHEDCNDTWLFLALLYILM